MWLWIIHLKVKYATYELLPCLHLLASLGKEGGMGFLHANRNNWAVIFSRKKKDWLEKIVSWNIIQKFYFAF